MNPKPHFNTSLSDADPLIAAALAGEKERQQSQIELIASENLVSRAVLDALGHEMTNKTLEGYPGNRFHGGADYADVVETAAIDRGKALFGCEYVNAQPHSGTQANQAVFFALLEPGDVTLGLDLAAGGHLSHGAKPNLSGRWFNAHHYTVDRETGLIDYDALAAQAETLKPKLLIAGGSAYPRCFDFVRMREIADACGALFLVDMAHFAGLVAAGVHPSPVPIADIVTCTTTKTLRGPRGGLILSRDCGWHKKLQAAIFPGIQGSLHTQVIAAKAICLGEALKPEFRQYGQNVKENAETLSSALQTRGLKVISGGTDTHIVLLDLSPLKVKGQRLQDLLYAANITSNKNPIPFDSPRPSEWAGIRLGTGAATTRGFRTAEFHQIGNLIADMAIAAKNSADDGDLQDLLQSTRNTVAQMCLDFPIYE